MRSKEGIIMGAAFLDPLRFADFVIRRSKNEDRYQLLCAARHKDHSAITIILRTTVASYPSSEWVSATGHPSPHNHSLA